MCGGRRGDPAVFRVVLTVLSSTGALLDLFVCLAVTLMIRALAEWKRTRFASRVHLLWFLSAGAAVALALARDYQGRRTTLLFGSPSDASLAIGGAALCLVLRALDQRLRALVGDRAAYVMLPIVFLAVIEGGKPAIAIGNGFVVAWFIWDAASGWRARHDGHALRVLGLLAQSALLALFLVPPAVPVRNPRRPRVDGSSEASRRWPRSGSCGRG